MYGGDTNKAANAGKTLARFAVYFRSHWVLLLAVVALAVGSTWAQVSTPELTGQVVDCFLTPAASALSGGSFPAQRGAGGGQLLAGGG
jgi:ATP-binding cassette subfamily B protein